MEKIEHAHEIDSLYTNMDNKNKTRYVVYAVYSFLRDDGVLQKNRCISHVGDTPDEAMNFHKEYVNLWKSIPIGHMTELRCSRVYTVPPNAEIYEPKPAFVIYNPYDLSCRKNK